MNSHHPTRGESGDRAADFLEVRLDDTPAGPVSRLVRGVAAFAVAAIAGSGEELLPGLDLVVTRRDSGTEILRVRAGQGEEASRLLDRTRHDLDTMSVEQFVRSWRSFDD